MNHSVKITGAGCSIPIPKQVMELVRSINGRGELSASFERIGIEKGSVHVDKSRVHFVVACASMSELDKKMDEASDLLYTLLVNEQRDLDASAAGARS